MASDIEMIPNLESPPPVDDDEEPPHHEAIVVEDTDSSHPPDPPSTPPLQYGEASTSSSSSSSSAGDITPVASKGKRSKPTSATKPAPTATGAKPKSKAAAPRSPSPSPPPPPPPRPPLQTIRLDIKLGGPDHYEVNISSLAKESGQRAATPVVQDIKPDSTDDSHSEGDDEGDGKPKKRKRKKANATDYYDTTDPFIDDSELAVDERTYFAQTKQQGFYVSSGQVALLDVPAQKKPKSKKINILNPAASVSQALQAASLPPSLAPLSLNNPSSSRSLLNEPTTPQKPTAEGTRDSPIALLSDNEDDRSSTSGTKRKPEGDPSSLLNGLSSSNGGTSKKKRKTEIQPFHPDLMPLLEELKAAIARENWEQKGKFPPAMKPLLSQVALKAIILGDYNENFFNLMPRLFPYNKFTMTKLIKRTIWREHTNLLVQRQNAILEELAELAKEGFPKAKEEWEKNVLAWEKRQERAKAEADGGGPINPVNSVEGTPVPDATPTNGSTALPPRDDPGNETGIEHDDVTGQTASAKGAKDTHPPQKRYRLTDTMKTDIWQLVCLSNECCRIENEKNQLEGSNQVVSDQGVRKALYQKIVACFPDGWLSSGQISREVSVMKKKLEKDE
ncbi:hypothetical protein ABKN59_011519 [Abortiporus biennis]